MSRKYKFRNQDRLYFVTYTVVDWIDLFIRNIYKDILLDSWRFCQDKKGLDVYAWVLMTSHAHMIIGSHGDKLEKIMQCMKQYTSARIKEEIMNYRGESRRSWLLELMTRAGTFNGNNKNFQLWQQDNHPIELFNLEIAHQKLRYIHDNPVVAGFVEQPEHYLYSSARDYFTNKKGLIDISLLDPYVISF